MMQTVSFRFNLQKNINCLPSISVPEESQNFLKSFIFRFGYLLIRENPKYCQKHAERQECVVFQGILNTRKITDYFPFLSPCTLLPTCKLGNPIPTTKLALQFTNTAIAMALGRGPCEKSSAVIIHGMDPGPTAKNTTNANVDITDRQDIQSIISCT